MNTCMFINQKHWPCYMHYWSVLADSKYFWKIPVERWTHCPQLCSTPAGWICTSDIICMRTDLDKHLNLNRKKALTSFQWEQNLVAFPNTDFSLPQCPTPVSWRSCAILPGSSLTFLVIFLGRTHLKVCACVQVLPPSPVRSTLRIRLPPPAQA